MKGTVTNKYLIKDRYLISGECFFKNLLLDCVRKPFV